MTEEEPIDQSSEKTPREKIDEAIGDEINFFETPNELLTQLPKRVNVRNILALGFDHAEAAYITKSIYSFVEAPLFTDKFENHKERIEWEKKIEKKLDRESFYYLQRNKLSTTGLNLLFAPLQLMSANIPGRYFPDPAVQELAEKVMALYDQMESRMSNYNSLSLKEKIELVREAEREAINFLKLLEESETNEQKT